MKHTLAVGIDPGLVNTGVVAVDFDSGTKHITVIPHVVDFPRAHETHGPAVSTWVRALPTQWGAPHIFIEDYNPRSSFNTDKRMIDLVAQIARATHGTRINNTGVKKVVRQPLMQLLHLWSFAQSTHHQDLRSAARIMLYGMLKNERLNQLLTTVVMDHCDGSSWTVHVN